MKFLVDECVGPVVAQWLKQKYDAISIYDYLTGIDDNDVLQKAFLENRILITSDKDFGEIIFKSKKQHCGIILLRLDDERPSNKIVVLDSVLQRHSEELFGNFVVITEKTIRVIKMASILEN
jgi:predicted nuclease of predicted toxin-antitoxin system